MPLSGSAIPPPLQAAPYVVVSRTNEDLSHLKILAICHWVAGGLTGFFSCFAIVYIVMGILMLNGVFSMAPPAPTTRPSPANTLEADRVFGTFMVVFGSLFFIAGITLASLTVYSGFCIKNRKRRTFSIVIAGINCLHMPLGTLLGVFTIIVLVRDSVKALYQTDAVSRLGGA